MMPGALRQDQNTDHDEGANDCRSERPAEVEPAGAYRFVEKIADGGAERSRQDECGPEQEHTGDAGRVLAVLYPRAESF